MIQDKTKKQTIFEPKKLHNVPFKGMVQPEKKIILKSFLEHKKIISRI